MEFRDYKHMIPIQVRFSDVDRLNHVNNACYLSYFELGRVKYFNAILQPHINWNKNGFVLARTEIDHLVPLYLDDEVFCFTKAIRFGTKSLTLQNSVVKKTPAGLVECAVGMGILVAMDYQSGTSIELPAPWRELMESFEK